MVGRVSLGPTDWRRSRSNRVWKNFQKRTILPDRSYLESRPQVEKTGKATAGGSSARGGQTPGTAGIRATLSMVLNSRKASDVALACLTPFISFCVRSEDTIVQIAGPFKLARRHYVPSGREEDGESVEESDLTDLHLRVSIHRRHICVPRTDMQGA